MPTLNAKLRDVDGDQVYHFVAEVSNSYVPTIVASAPQALSDAGAVTITEYKTDWTTTGATAPVLA